MALVVAAALAGAVCLSGLGIAYVAYDQATKLDRSDPVVVVEQYIAAVFDERDQVRASQFTCHNAELDGIDAMLHDIEGREKQFATSISVSTANYETTVSGQTATVVVDLKVTTSVSRSNRRWKFDLQEQSDWRVCGAQRID